MRNLKGEIQCLKEYGIKPNFSELARTYGVDRRTVKKMYLGKISKQKKQTKSSKLDKHKELIKTKLEIPGCNMRAIYEFIIDSVDTDIGSYSNFRKYIKKHPELIKVKKQDIHPRFETEMGLQLQFDWKGPITLHKRSGEEVIFYVFSATLCASRMHFYEYSNFMTKETVERCLIHVFERMNGVPKEILTDNMSSIVNYSQHAFVSEFIAFCKDMGTIPKKCKVGACETKGKDESCNRFVNWILPYDYEFDTEEELIEILSSINNKVNLEVNATTNMPPISLFQIEKEYLQPLPKQAIIANYIDSMIPVKVSNESLFYYKGTKYSVSTKYIGHTIKLEEKDNKLYVYYNSDLITTHDISNKKIKYHEEHYKECLNLAINNKSEIEIDEIAKKNLELLDKLVK